VLATRKWLLWGLPTLGITLALSLWWVWIPAWALDGVRQRLEEKAGVACTIRDLDLGLSSLRMNDVRLLSPGHALDLRITSIQVDASLFDLASGSASSLESISFVEPRLTVDTSALGLERTLRGIRERLGRASADNTEVSTAEPARHRLVRVEAASVEIRDADGVLAIFGGIDMDWDGERLEVDMESARVESGGPDRLELTSSSSGFRRYGGEWKVGSTSFGSLRFISAPSARDERGEGLHAEVRRARSLLTRLRRARDASLGAAALEPGGPAVERAWYDRLAPGFRFRLASGSVARVVDEEWLELIQMQGGVQLIEPGVLHVQASGAADAGASVSANVEVRAEEAQIVGDIGFRDFPVAPLIAFLPSLPWYRPEDISVSGELSIDEVRENRFAVEGRVQTQGLALRSNRIAAGPVRDLDFEVSGRGSWEPDDRRLVIEQSTLRRDTFSTGLRGSVAWPTDHYQVDLRVETARVSCQGLVDAIPRDLTGEVTGFRLGGSWAARAHVQIDQTQLGETQLDVDVSDGCQFLEVPPLADLRRIDGAFRHRVTEPDGSVFAMTTGPGTPAWQSRSGLSPFFVSALLTREDGAFRSHGGFSVSSIRDALIRNLREGRFVYGASTITMQLAKNLFLSREKTLARKTQEVLLAWMLEHLLSKDEMLGIYANIVEFGRGMYGIRHASRRYFGRTPAGLSPAEATFLASVLPNPKVQHGQLFRGELSGTMRARMGRVLRRMGDRGRMSPEEMNAGLQELEAFAFFPGQSRAPWSLPEEPTEPGSDEEASSSPDEESGDAPPPLSDEEQWQREEEQLGGSPTQW